MRIVGDKVYLRAIESSDNVMLFEMINDPKIEKMVGGFSWPVSKEEQEIWQRGQIGRKDILRCIIAEKNSDCPVGTIILSDIDYRNGISQLHIKILEKNRGKGFGFDAVHSLLKYSFSELRLNCIFAEILPYNAASISLFEKSGFKKEGVLRKRVFKDGQFWDVLSYSILSCEME